MNKEQMEKAKLEGYNDCLKEVEKKINEQIIKEKENVNMLKDTGVGLSFSMAQGRLMVLYDLKKQLNIQEKEKPFKKCVGDTEISKGASEILDIFNEDLESDDMIERKKVNKFIEKLKEEMLISLKEDLCTCPACVRESIDKTAKEIFK